VNFGIILFEKGWSRLNGTGLRPHLPTEMGLLFDQGIQAAISMGYRYNNVMITPTLTHDLDTVRKIVLEGLKNYQAKVYLFGSQATGKARLHSDIDVAILPVQPIPSLTLSGIRDTLEESDVVRHVDVVDLSETDKTFQNRVKREGVLWKG
jgi:uncharacterized protein